MECYNSYLPFIHKLDAGNLFTFLKLEGDSYLKACGERLRATIEYRATV